MNTSLAIKSSLIVLTSLTFFSARGFCDQKKDPLGLAITLSSAAGVESSCESFGSNLKAHINAEKRFSVDSSEDAPLQLQISCGDGKLSGQVTYNLNGEMIIVSSYTTKLSDMKLLKIALSAQAFWGKLTERMPWNGEVTSISKATSPTGKMTESLPLRAKGHALLGPSGGGPLKECMPIEIGELVKSKDEETGEFRPMYRGLLRDVRSSEVKFEVYAKGDPTKADRVYFVRLADATQQSKAMNQIITYCQNHPEEAMQANLSDMMANVFGKDPVEVNSVQQRFGVAIGSIRGGNGTSSKIVAAAYMHNRLLFGQSFMLDAFGTRSIYAKAYEGLETNTRLDPPEVTEGEIFTAIRFKYGRASMNLGPGLIIEKTNIPFIQHDNPDVSDIERVEQRTSSARFGAILGTNIAGEKSNFGLRVPIAQSQGKIFASFHSYYAYRISKTWLTGVDGMFISSRAKQPTAPTATFFALGGFLGIEIGR